MTKPSNLAGINSTQTIIGAQSLWKKIGGYCCLNYNIYYNPRFQLYTMCKSGQKEEEEEEEAITNAVSR